MLTAFTFGFLIAFVSSLPMAGPVGALMLGKGLDGQSRAALHIGWGCAAAEGLYAALAFLGFSALLARYPLLGPTSQAIAAVMLFGLGFHFVMRKRLPRGAVAEDLARPLRGFLTGFTVTALNVSLLATWGAGATLTLSASNLDPDALLSLPFGMGAVVGMSVWYAFFVAMVRRHLHRFQLHSLHTFVRGLGCVLVGLGISFVWMTSEGLV